MKKYYEMKDFDRVLKDFLPSEIVELTCHPLFHKSHNYFFFKDNIIASYNTIEQLNKALGIE